MKRYLVCALWLISAAAAADPVSIDFEEFPDGLNPGPPESGVSSQGFTITSGPNAAPFAFTISGTDDKRAASSAGTVDSSEFVLIIRSAEGLPFRLLSLDSDAVNVTGVKADGSVITRTLNHGYRFGSDWQNLVEVKLFAEGDGSNAPTAWVDNIRVSLDPADHLRFAPVIGTGSGRVVVRNDVKRSDTPQQLRFQVSGQEEYMEPYFRSFMRWRGDDRTPAAASFAEIGVSVDDDSIDLVSANYASGQSNILFDVYNDINNYAFELESPQLVTVAGYYEGEGVGVSLDSGLSLWLGPGEFLELGYDFPRGRTEFSEEVLLMPGTYRFGNTNHAFGGSLSGPVWYSVRFNFSLSFSDPVAQSVEVDFDPWSEANEIDPDSAGLAGIGVMTTSIADGDATDFDATQLDPATLRFGPAEASNIAVPIASDLDRDGDTDIVFGFRIEDAGIACEDTEINLSGMTYSGLPVIGSDSITTVDCTVGGCHP